MLSTYAEYLHSKGRGAGAIKSFTIVHRIVIIAMEKNNARERVSESSQEIWHCRVNKKTLAEVTRAKGEGTSYTIGLAKKLIWVVTSYRKTWTNFLANSVLCKYLGKNVLGTGNSKCKRPPDTNLSSCSRVNWREGGRRRYQMVKGKASKGLTSKSEWEETSKKDTRRSEAISGTN